MFLIVAIEVARKTIAEMVENGGKWQKIDFRGYLVGNGFPRIIRHSPTTIDSFVIPIKRFVELKLE